MQCFRVVRGAKRRTWGVFKCVDRTDQSIPGPGTEDHPASVVARVRSRGSSHRRASHCHSPQEREAGWLVAADEAVARADPRAADQPAVRTLAAFRSPQLRDDGCRYGASAAPKFAGGGIPLALVEELDRSLLSQTDRHWFGTKYIDRTHATSTTSSQTRSARRAGHAGAGQWSGDELKRDQHCKRLANGLRRSESASRTGNSQLAPSSRP